MASPPNAKTTGRFAGLAYLVIILFSIAGYATLTRLLAGSSPNVLARLVADQTLFTLAFASSVIGFAAWAVLVILLYRLLSSASRIAGLLMVALAMAGVAMNLAALFQLCPLVSLGAGLDAAALTPMVERYRRLMLLAQVFSGLWLFPFGWLVVRSWVAPRLLGLCLIVGGFGYLLVFATAFAPDFGQMLAYKIASAVTGIPALVGEFGMCLWLLIKGARAAETPSPRA